MNISSTREEVMDDENESFITTMDPIQYFPSEISIPIIQAALPSDGSYSACLLDLTNVSQKWQTLLLYTPMLWSQLYIDETLPDWLATLSLSINLADQVNVKLVLYGRPIHDWTVLGRLLLPAYERITSVAVMVALDQYPYVCDGVLSDFFDHFGYPPNMRNLIFDDKCSLNLYWSALRDLPPTVRIVGTVGVGNHIPSLEHSKQLFDKAKYDTIRLKQHNTDDRSILYPLTLILVRQRGGDLSLLCSGANLPLQEYQANPLDEYTTLEHFICATTSSLCSLEISFGWKVICDLVDCLQELCSLQVIALDIYDIQKIQPPHLNPTNVVVSALQDCKLRFIMEKNIFDAVRDEGLTFQLFELLTRLYPRIQKLSLDGPSWPSDKLSIFENLPTLKDLQLNLRAMVSSPVEFLIKLPWVEILRLENIPPLGDLTAPNLCRLRLGDTDLTARFSIDTDSLYYLIVIIGDKGQVEFYLDPTTFPGIKKLRLENCERTTQWGLGSFLHLVSIDLDTISASFNTLIGDSLCLHFIYYPDSCPSLQELSSNRCFEWDLLFLMLQRHNFGIQGVGKIQTVTIPFVPFHFRKHFELLLKGKHSEGPSFISQTLGATREVVFDANIPGCYCCLRNQRPNCIEEVRKGSPFWFVDHLYPRLRNPPVTMAPEIRGHILQHKKLVDEWKESYESCSFHRTDACNRWP